jgi:hypothetical protein
MKPHPHQRRAGLARFVRGLRPDRNPLRRRWDRAEGFIVTGFLAAFLAAAPVAAVAAWHGAYTANLGTQRTEAAARHPVTAVLLADAPRPSDFSYGQAVPPRVRAQWVAPNGTPHTGDITVAAGAQAGATVTVWADASGRLHGRPLTHDQVVGRAVVAAAAAPIGLGLVLLAAGAAVHWVLQRRRLAAWQAEWAITEPQWTSRRPS